MTQLLVERGVETGSLPFGELVQRCRDEIHRFRQRDPRAGFSACMELFRRAVEQRDERAWSAIYDLYHALVQSWARDLHSDLKEPDVVVHEAFARFACAFTAEKLARSASAGAVLAYLKRCTYSAVLDAQRRSPPSISLDALLEEPGSANEALMGDGADDPADQVIGRLSALGIWQMLQHTLKAREQALLLLLYQGMTPVEISRQYPQVYPSVGAIYQMQRTLRQRLDRKSLARCAPAPTGATARENAPRSHPPAPREGEPGAQTSEECHTETSPVVLASLIAPASEPESNIPGRAERLMAVIAECSLEAHPVDAGHNAGERAPSPCVSAPLPPARGVTGGVGTSILAPSHDPVKPEQQASEPKIHYHLQLAFCGKGRCRKCREGRGHGPYWYEYRFCEGHTIKRYIGKTLPSPLPEASTVSGCE